MKNIIIAVATVAILTVSGIYAYNSTKSSKECCQKQTSCQKDECSKDDCTCGTECKDKNNCDCGCSGC